MSGALRSLRVSSPNDCVEEPAKLKLTARSESCVCLCSLGNLSSCHLQ